MRELRRDDFALVSGGADEEPDVIIVTAPPPPPTYYPGPVYNPGPGSRPPVFGGGGGADPDDDQGDEDSEEQQANHEEGKLAFEAINADIQQFIADHPDAKYIQIGDTYFETAKLSRWLDNLGAAGDLASLGAAALTGDPENIVDALADLAVGAVGAYLGSVAGPIGSFVVGEALSGAIDVTHTPGNDWGIEFVGETIIGGGTGPTSPYGPYNPYGPSGGGYPSGPTGGGRYHIP